MRTRVRVTVTDISAYPKYILGDEGLIDGYVKGNDNIIYGIVVLTKSEMEQLSKFILCPLQDLICIGIMDLYSDKDFILTETE